VSSNQDFGVEQFFQADEFQADDPSPKIIGENDSFLLLKIITPM
jgi:hypothetical protein